MAWWNPWGEARELKAKLAENYVNTEKTLARLLDENNKLKLTKKENEREIVLLEKELKAARDRLAEAMKNDTRDSKGRFTKAKK